MNLREYHDRTKHSLASINANRHMLDWANQPLPFKIYTSLEPIPLPHPPGHSDVPALDAVAASAPREPLRTLPDLPTLARLFYLSAGITRTKRYPGGQEMHFRAAANTGALYHIDLYLVAGDLPGLSAGVYHFGPHDFALRRLRAGDYRRVLVDAAAGTPAIEAAPAVVVCASTFWRNAWKYQSRAYRHAYWDSGTLLANLLAVAAADGVPTRLVVGFVDAAVNGLLGLDGEREASLVLIALGDRPELRAPVAPPQPALEAPTQPLSRGEVDYPLIRAAHAASSLDTAADVRRWQSATGESAPPPAPTGEAVALRPLEHPATRSIDDVILRRGSSRRFARAPIGFAQLSTMLHASTRGVPGDWAQPDRPLAEPYLIVNAVDGLASGTYRCDPRRDVLEPLRRGELRREAGFLDLGQELAADAAANMYMLSDLRCVMARLGERGYRAASLEAAIVGGKLYLAAYALDLGATGLTFFDDDVIRFFSPAADGDDVLFLVAAGFPARARR